MILNVNGSRGRVRTYASMIQSHLCYHFTTRLLIYMVEVAGLEPASRRHQFLRLARLPVSPHLVLFIFGTPSRTWTYNRKLRRPVHCPLCYGRIWCHLLNSNQQPSPYHGAALPLELKWHNMEIPVGVAPTLRRLQRLALLLGYGTSWLERVMRIELT